MDRPTILIGGGYDKDSTYDNWIYSFEGKVKKLVLIGQTREKIADCAVKCGFLKEDILFAVTDKITAESNRMLGIIRDRTDLNGKEKLKTIFKESILRPVQDEIFTVAPNLSCNPRLIYSMFRETVVEAGPDYIVPIIKEGIADGSIQTDYPEELGELIILVANIWLNPMIFDNTVEETYKKSLLFRQMMQGFGLDIVDDEMLKRLRELTVIYQKNK